MQEIDYTDIYCSIRFLQKIYTNWLQYSRQKSSESSLKLIDYAREWKGGSADEFSRHLRTIQKLKNELPPAAKGTINDHMLHDLVITSLKSHSDLSAIHTLLRVKFVEKPQEITFSHIESQVNMILTDVKPETSKSLREDEPIASLTTAYFTQQKNKWPSRGNLTGTQSRSPIKKDVARDKSQPGPLQRIPSEVWDKMNKEARDQYLQIKRRQQGIRRSGRGRGGRLNQSQRPNLSKSDADP